MVLARLPELRSIFAAFDRDGNSVISKQEFKNGIAVSPRLAAIFKVSDWRAAAGDDCVLSFEEFVNLARSAGTLDERPVFNAGQQWAVVPAGDVCPAGLEYKMDLSTGQVLARLPSPQPRETPRR